MIPRLAPGPALTATGVVAVGARGSLIGDALDGGSLTALSDRARALLAAAAPRERAPREAVR
ncbi:hypothetical protein OG979_17400 [Actinomadura citrea]|uniref:hypothetical protein n=1 Tax=Actinomadura citrea TaxID=46158 RepID=UPI002E2A2DE7|nr:hypothetical protein [Actinomadura citrea]